MEALDGVYQDPAEDGAVQVQGAAGSLLRLVSVYADDGLTMIWSIWRSGRNGERRQADHQRMLDSTAEVRVWRGDDFGRAKRVPLADLAAWVKPGHVLLERVPDVRAPSDQGSDAMSLTHTYRVVTMPIGGELPEGTIKAKRMVGGTVQYLVRPRSKAAERTYQLRRRLEQAELERPDLDMSTAEQRAAHAALIADLRMQLGES